jgi:DNA-directed RNA polymerase subunit RPC12/RpoP
MTTKCCSSCKSEKKLSEFNKNKSGKLGVHNQCKECARLWKPSPDQRQKYNKRIREWNRKKLSGFTSEDFESKLKEQGYKCAICGTEDPGATNWHADHDHKTNTKRGVLCHKCNTGLGLLKDDINVLCSAIEYLNHYTR